MTDHTHIDEPSVAPGEAEMILFALERSRAQFAWKTGGLDAAGLTRRQPPSELTLAGLLKHLALVEDMTVADHLTGGPPAGPWRREDFAADPDFAWHSAVEHTPEELYALWQGAVDRAREAWATALADGGLDQPSQATYEGYGTPNLRRPLTDLHDEYARHVGHADLLREAVDGLVGEDPPQH